MSIAAPRHPRRNVVSSRADLSCLFRVISLVATNEPYFATPTTTKPLMRCSASPVDVDRRDRPSSTTPDHLFKPSAPKCRSVRRPSRALASTVCDRLALSSASHAQPIPCHGFHSGCSGQPADAATTECSELRCRPRRACRGRGARAFHQAPREGLSRPSGLRTRGHPPHE